MRNTLIAMALFAALAPTAALADVAPLTPEGAIMMGKRQAFENHARASFGDHGLIEKLREWRKNWGFIIVGKEGSRAAPRVLVKDEYGWYEMEPGATRRIDRQVGHELNRLLTSVAIWSEQPYNWGSKCQATPRLFVVAHAGHDTFGRLGCGPEGLAARTARIAETLRPIGGRDGTILPAADRPPAPGVPRDQQITNADIFERLSDKTAAWERKTLAGYVEPYADDATVDGPQGKIVGRKAIVDWARYLQDWNAAYSESDRIVLHQMTMPAQEGNIVYTTHEVRWRQDGKPVRQTFSTMWRNNGGLWQIAYERVSEVKPVTDRVPL